MHRALNGQHSMSYRESAQKYIELRNQGLGASEAFQQAFPNGIQRTQAEDLADAQQDAAMGQAAGMVGGLLASKGVYDLASGAPKVLGIIDNPFAAEAAAKAAEVSGLAGGSATGGGGAAIGSGAEVGTFDATGPIGSSIGTVAQGALGAAGLGLGAKGVYDAYEAGDPLSGALSGAGMGAGGLGLAGALGLSTGGLALPVIGAAALLGGGAGFLGDRKTTKEYQAERTQDLLDRGSSPFIDQSIAQLRGAQAGDVAGADPRHRERMQAVWDQYGKHGPQDLTKTIPELVWGSHGVMDTFGPDEWLGQLNEQQRFDVSQALIDRGVFSHNKGDVVIADDQKARAQQIKEQVLGGALLPALQAQQQPNYQQWSNGIPPEGGVIQPLPGQAPAINRPLVGGPVTDPTLQDFYRDNPEAYRDRNNENLNLQAALIGL